MVGYGLGDEKFLAAVVSQLCERRAASRDSFSGANTLQNANSVTYARDHRSGSAFARVRCLVHPSAPVSPTLAQTITGRTGFRADRGGGGDIGIFGGRGGGCHGLSRR